MSGTDETTIGQIRQRTEEEELRQRLKSTVGGYSKSSVMEYLAEIRKQQQTSYETFNQNMQALLEEKENLKADNEKLLMQVAQAKAEFQKTAELKKQQTQVRQEPAAGNIVYLNGGSKTDAMSESPQTGEPEEEDETLALKAELSEKDSELEKLRQELKSQKELLAYEKMETKKQRDLAEELSDAYDQMRNELDSFKETYSEAAFTELQDRIELLDARVKKQEELICKLENLSKEKDEKLKDLSQEAGTMMENMELMASSLDDMTVQNEKLLAANNAMAKAYEDANRKTAKFINEISEVRQILGRTLEEAVENLTSAGKLPEQAGENDKNADSRSSIA
jgi:chromosome segregation ATPase